MSAFLRRVSPLCMLMLLVLALQDTRAFTDDGHRLIGGIADARLAGTPTGERVTALLDGLTLADAATIADDLKAWEKLAPDQPGSYHLTAHPELDRQLVAFWLANNAPAYTRSEDDTDEKPSHSWFHYTNIPVVGAQKYAVGKVGRSKWDLVQMIGYCVKVLDGRIPEENTRAITKPVAVVLLAHYLGDLHQPLHVGAMYFDRAGKPVDPDSEAAQADGYLGDIGGNTLMLQLPPEPTAEGGEAVSPPPMNLHLYWDLEAERGAEAWWQGLFAKVATLRQQIKKVDEPDASAVPAATVELPTRLGGSSPLDLVKTGNVDPSEWPRLWADDMMPIAHQAHERLDLSALKPMTSRGSEVVGGPVMATKSGTKLPYDQWAAETSARQLHLAGWRLATLLTAALPESAAEATTPRPAAP